VRIEDGYVQELELRSILVKCMLGWPSLKLARPSKEKHDHGL